VFTVEKGKRRKASISQVKELKVMIEKERSISPPREKEYPRPKIKGEEQIKTYLNFRARPNQESFEKSRFSRLGNPEITTMTACRRNKKGLFVFCVKWRTVRSVWKEQFFPAPQKKRPPRKAKKFRTRGKMEDS